MLSFAINALVGPIALVAHDAGAANLAFAWVKDSRKPVRPFVQGPAVDLWNASKINSPLHYSLDDVLEGASNLISGTGWSSNLEHNARVKAHAAGIKVIAVVDHWVNYSMRFERDGILQLPDEIWVADAWALEIAKETFPNLPVLQLKNTYLETQIAKVSASPKNGTLLYVLEPVRDSWGREDSGEFQALEFTLEHVKKNFFGKVTKIILRPHPSESPLKYQKYIGIDSRITIDSFGDLSYAISQADVVVGVESFALTIALAAGRSVFSSLPPWAPKLKLPQLEIKQIRYFK
jgi:hypothetical protein